MPVAGLARELLLLTSNNDTTQPGVANNNPLTLLHCPRRYKQTSTCEHHSSIHHTLFSCRAVMDVLDGATRLEPDMNDEAQRWIETANSRNKSTSPVFDELTSLRATTEHSASQSPAKFRSPPSSRKATKSTRSQVDRNTFEESFAAALAKPPTTYDGHFDHDDAYDDQTPLLNSYYKTSHSPVQETSHTPRHAPLEPPSKSKPSRSICLWNEVSHNSQYTRPAAEILREVLEVRYPVASAPTGYERLSEDQESGAISAEHEVRARRRWWRKLLRGRVSG